MSRRHVGLAVQVAVTVALLAILFWRFDWADFLQVLRRISFGFYLATLAATAAGQLLYALRWRVMLGGMGLQVPYREVVQQYLVAFFLGNLMPTTVGGDAAKVYYLGRRVGYVEVGASVFVDRFLGFLCLAVIGGALAWSGSAPSRLFVLNRNLLTMFAATFAGILAISWLAPIERLVPARLRWDRLSSWSARTREFVGYVRLGACRFRTLAAAAAVVFAYAALMTLVYRRFFLATGVHVPPVVSVMNVIVSMSIFVNVPISVNGIGLREQLHYLLFAALGLPKEVSVSVSLLVFSHFLVISLAGYGLWLRARTAVPEPAV